MRNEEVLYCTSEKGQENLLSNADALVRKDVRIYCKDKCVIHFKKRDEIKTILQCER